MSTISVGFGPNQIEVQYAPGNTNWNKVLDANSNTFPALPPGCTLQGISLRTVATGGTSSGSPFQVAFNQASAPSFGYLVGGEDGADLVLPITVWNIWIKLTASTDKFEALGYF